MDSPLPAGFAPSGEEADGTPAAAPEDANHAATDGRDDRQRRVRRTPRVVVSLGGAEAQLRGRLELDPENWALRRQFGEALLDTGSREDGLCELELAMVGFEMQEDLDRAQEFADVIIAFFRRRCAITRSASSMPFAPGTGAG